MTDFHSHILFNIDDGATDIETALEMLEKEKEQGVKNVVLTSHFWEAISLEDFLRIREERFSKLKEKASGINLYLGAEIKFSAVKNKFEDFSPLAISGTNGYALIELPFTDRWHSDLIDRVDNWCYDNGIKPIIAHVERYSHVIRHPEVVAEMVNRGFLMQVNYPSFLSKEHIGLVKRLVKKNQVHVLGSDAHNLTQRAPKIKEASEFIIKTFGQGFFDSIEHNMQAILRGKDVIVPKATPIKKVLKMYI